ncbi:uncharacterized protein LOC62_03G004119 [Vanrija pseudolonga]|uniref:BTB domain-containing protein n=1 Tax=Vanrija pseudolonga TaxID=143232 RepID=A0AAF1BQ88_9TREE|nr:hypothetical protein LOC62_03G004119 [Vanrija pseudolonga]
MAKAKPKLKKPASAKRKRGDDESAGSSAPDGAIVDDRTWTNGDFTLISSDNVRFRVDGVHLFSPSAVFRAAADLNPRDRTARFTDTEYETASVVKNFLDFVVKFRTSQFKEQHRRMYISREGVSPFVQLARFLHKYDSRVELRRLLYVFGKEVGHSYDLYARDSFIIAALAGDVNACSDAIEATSGASDKGTSDSFMDLHALVPANIPPVVKEMIPAHYWVALCKGWERSGKHRNRSEWAHHFELLIDGGASK